MERGRGGLNVVIPKATGTVQNNPTYLVLGSAIIAAAIVLSVAGIAALLIAGGSVQISIKQIRSNFIFVYEGEESGLRFMFCSCSAKSYLLCSCRSENAEAANNETPLSQLHEGLQDPPHAASDATDNSCQDPNLNPNQRKSEATGSLDTRTRDTSGESDGAKTVSHPISMCEQRGRDLDGSGTNGTNISRLQNPTVGIILKMEDHLNDLFNKTKDLTFLHQTLDGMIKRKVTQGEPVKET